MDGKTKLLIDWKHPPIMCSDVVLITFMYQLPGHILERNVLEVGGQLYI